MESEILTPQARENGTMGDKKYFWQRIQNFIFFLKYGIQYHEYIK